MVDTGHAEFVLFSGNDVVEMQQNMAISKKVLPQLTVFLYPTENSFWLKVRWIMPRISFPLIILIMFPFILFQGCVRAITSNEIRGNLVEVSKNVETYSYEMEMCMETSVTGEDSPEIVNLKRHAHVDVKNKRMKALINIDEWATDKTESKSAQTEMYIFDTMEYLCSQNHEKEGKWVKLELPNKFDSENRLKKQMELFITSKATKLEDEPLGNIDCYLVTVEPDKEAFWKVIMEQEEEHPLLELLDLDYEDVVKEMDTKVWMTKDTFLPMKCDMQIQAVIGGKVMNELFEITINVKTVYRYHNYNKLGVIELPEEAKNAEIYEEEWD